MRLLFDSYYLLAKYMLNMELNMRSIVLMEFVYIGLFQKNIQAERVEVIQLPGVLKKSK